MASQERTSLTTETLTPHQLLDFDWKLKFAVSSDAIAAVNKPLLRLQLSLSANPVIVDRTGIVPAADASQHNPRVAVAEYSKTELDSLISELETISQALDGSNGG